MISAEKEFGEENGYKWALWAKPVAKEEMVGVQILSSPVFPCSTGDEYQICQCSQTSL